MCGFLGIFAAPAFPLSPAEIEHGRLASARLAHRGNTSRGESTGPAAALFHHRLAFRDLAEGKQPLTDRHGRATIIFNGELYDFHPLRTKLASEFEFQTRSDTEVILAAYLVLGERFLEALDGEYAFVIHDHRNGQVVAARDPFGVKPLFWNPGAAKNELRAYRERYEFNSSGALHFASEIKGLGLPLRWDQAGLDRLFLSLYEEAGTAFSGVAAMIPGALLVAAPAGDRWHCRIERQITKRRLPNAREGFEARAEELRRLISQNVRAKLDAEVPLGAYLSGGIDSRIAAFEMGRAGAEIETFTVGFEGADFDETPAVRAFLARYPNLRGRVLRTTDVSLAYSYPHAVYASELVQPYTNGAAKWWLSRFARRHVRGVLTGDGADELFGGYPSYRYLAWWAFYQRHPSAARARLYAERVIGPEAKFWERGLSSRPDGSDLTAANAALGWAHPLFAQISSVGTLWAGDRLPALLDQEASMVRSFTEGSGASPLGDWRTYFLHTHFATHVLNWVGDRMEMANTLEGRPIFLSRALLDFSRASPDHHLVRGMTEKALLRRAYRGELGSFAAAPKKQFNAPFLQGELGRRWLSPSALKETGLIDPAQITRAEAALHGADPLEASFARIFLQNCLVTQMLDRYLVRGEPPERDLAYEEHFLDQQTVTL